MEQAEHALAASDPDRLAAAHRSNARGRPPVGREPALGRREQNEHDRRRGRAHVFLVLQELSREERGGDDERRRATELRRFGGAGALLQERESVGAEHAEAPRLREVVVRREAGDVEQLEQRLAGHRPRFERLVGAPRVCELGQAHASCADT